MRAPTDIAEWLKSGAYLPRFMRDFHDQKDLFRTIHGTVSPTNESLKQVNWIAAHCYVIDIFLWWMAKRGYTLQRTRKDLPFNDLHADIAVYKDQQTVAFRQILDQRRDKTPSP